MVVISIIPFQTAYGGPGGRERREFCLRFTRAKGEVFSRIQGDIFAMIQSKGETTTCRKGCSVCCVHYIEANIQECEAIAYYLHENPELMESFLDRYAAWRSAMRRLGDPFAFCEEIMHQKGEHDLTSLDQQSLVEAMSHYQQQGIPCPFLDDGSCSIYAVRPYVCANHYVTTPSEWCGPGQICDSGARRPLVYMTDIDELYDLSFYRQGLPKPAIGFAPTNVFRILTEGAGFLEEATRGECLQE